MPDTAVFQPAPGLPGKDSGMDLKVFDLLGSGEEASSIPGVSGRF